MKRGKKKISQWLVEPISRVHHVSRWPKASKRTTTLSSAALDSHQCDDINGQLQPQRGKLSGPTAAIYERSGSAKTAGNLSYLLWWSLYFYDS